MEQKWLYGIIGLLSGILIAVLTASNVVNSNNQGMMRMMGMRMPEEMVEERKEMHRGGMDMSMNEMTEGLKEKSGDEFDKAFIIAMIDHHQGAIDIASLAKINAKHQEIKDLADDIIEAQTKEIEMMKQWRQNWGY